MKTMEAKFSRLEELGFETPKNALIPIEDVDVYYEEVMKERPELDYDIDGIVFSVNNLSEIKNLGVFEGRNKPKGQIALKFPAEGCSVTIKEVFYSYEGGQAITMVAMFDAVEMSGANIRKASLKSHRWMVENGVGVGSVVEIKRSGDIIPKIERIISNDGFVGHDFPTECAICGAEVVVNGAQLACSNSKCAAKEAYRVNRFLTVRKVKGLGHSTLMKYAELGITLIDFVSQNYDEIERKIYASGISDRVWSKIRKQLES